MPPIGSEPPIPEGPDYDIRVETSEQCITLKVHDDVTVRRLKRKIKKHLDIPMEQQLLKFNGQAMRDIDRMKDCGVVEDSTIKLEQISSCNMDSHASRSYSWQYNRRSSRRCILL